MLRRASQANLARSLVLDEMKDLQKSFRMLMIEKKKVLEEGQSILAKQQKSLESLRAELSKLHSALTQSQVIPNDTDFRIEKEREAMARRERIALEQALVAQQQRNEDISSTIDLLRQRYVAIKSMLASTGSLNQAEAIVKYLSVLESRLERSVVRLNEMAHSNAVLREEVDSCRRESATHADIEKKILEDTMGYKDLSSELMEQIEGFYSAKDKAIVSLAHLRSIADKEYLVYDKQWQSLNSELEQLMEVYEKKVKYLESHAIGRHKPVECVTSRFEICIDMDEARVESTLVPVTSPWDRIRECTGVESLSEFTSQFIEKDTQIFSLLNWSNQLQSQIEKLGYIVRSGEGLKAISDGHVDENFGEEENCDEFENFDEKIENIISQLGSMLGGNSGSGLGVTPEERVLLLLASLDTLVDSLVCRNSKSIDMSILPLPSSILAETHSDEEDMHPNIKRDRKGLGASTKPVHVRTTPRIIAVKKPVTPRVAPVVAPGTRPTSRPATPRSVTTRPPSTNINAKPVVPIKRTDSARTTPVIR